MTKRILAIAGVLFALATLQAAAQWHWGPVASQSLVSTLHTLRNLSDSSFQQVLWWAPNPSDPGITVPDWNNAEHQIMQLPRKDRDAVLAWLNGHGRQPLYDRGATDAMIGSRRPGTSGGNAAATPSPKQQYHILALTSPTLSTGGTPASGIVVTGGFALIKKDATKAVVCLSFKNVAAQPATEVDFAFPLLDGQGDNVGTLTLTRTGTFSPNIAIDGPQNADGYLSPGFGARSAFDNCLVSNQGTAALPLLQTRLVSYKVQRVLYANGTSWP